MFANAYQGGFLSIFFSVGSNPLAIWEKEVQNGHIRRVIDEEVKSLVLDIGGTNVATTYITCPIKARASLGIRLPFCVMIIKNMQKYFTFEIQILDDKDMRRRFRISNFQSTTKVRPFCTTMPIGLNAGWNQVRFNLADFTKRAYGSIYMETVRVQIHANVRIRRIYFTDQLRTDEELPNEFKLVPTKPGGKKPSKEGIAVPKLSVPKIEIRKSNAEPKDIPPPPSPAEQESPRLDEGDISPVPADSLEPPQEPTEEPAGDKAAPPADEPEGGEPAAPAEGEAEQVAVGEGETTQPEKTVEGQTESPPAEEAAAGPEQVSVQEGGEELAVETAIEPSENVAEATAPSEVTEEVTETEASPSEPATTDAED